MTISSDEPFGRQPKPVTVTIEGDDPRDVAFWSDVFFRRAEYKGDMAQRLHPSAFIIYPRAVND